MNAAQNTPPARQNWPSRADRGSGRENVLVIQSPAEGGKTGVYTHLLSTPNDQVGREIVFDFRRLRGRDMLDVESEVKAKGSGNADLVGSKAFQLHLAAKAAGLGADVLEVLPYRDFSRITTAAQNFLSPAGCRTRAAGGGKKVFACRRRRAGALPIGWI